MLLFVSIPGYAAAPQLPFYRSTPESFYQDVALVLGENKLSCERQDDTWTRSMAVSAHVIGSAPKIFEMLACWNEETGSGTWYHRFTICKPLKQPSARVCATEGDLSGPWSKGAQTILSSWIKASGFESQESLVSADARGCFDGISVLVLETGPAGHRVIRGCPRYGTAEDLFRKIVVASINVPFERDPDAYWSSRALPAAPVVP